MSTQQLKLVGHFTELTGDGNELKLLIKGHRRTRTGEFKCYEIMIDLHRFNVRRFLEQTKLMHVRDRDRISGELHRIENEIKAVAP